MSETVAHYNYFLLITWAKVYIPIIACDFMYVFGHLLMLLLVKSLIQRAVIMHCRYCVGVSFDYLIIIVQIFGFLYTIIIVPILYTATSCSFCFKWREAITLVVKQDNLCR